MGMSDSPIRASDLKTVKLSISYAEPGKYAGFRNELSIHGGLRIRFKDVYVDICPGNLWNKQASPVKRDVVSLGRSILNPAHPVLCRFRLSTVALLHQRVTEEKARITHTCDKVRFPGFGMTVSRTGQVRRT